MKMMSTLLIALAIGTAPAVAGTCNSGHTTEASYSDAQLAKGHHAVDDIVDTAAAAGSFTTLLAAADAAGLVSALQGDGPLTVFAPTDAAFAALPAGTVESLLLPENKDQLAGILKLHVIAGAKITSDQLSGRQVSAESLNGTLNVDGTDGVTVNGATVIQADVEATNGVIHVIDQVLLPETH